MSNVRTKIKKHRKSPSEYQINQSINRDLNGQNQIVEQNSYHLTNIPAINLPGNYERDTVSRQDQREEEEEEEKDNSEQYQHTQNNRSKNQRNNNNQPRKSKITIHPIRNSITLLKLISVLLISQNTLFFPKITVKAQFPLLSTNSAKQYQECPDPSSPEQIFDFTGELTSSNYPTSNYNDGQNCSWVIQAPNNKRIKLLILEARLEATSSISTRGGGNCVDYLEIRDPIVPADQQDAETNHGLYHLCEVDYNDKSHTLTVISEGSSLEINLLQDGSVNDIGFRIKWVFVDKNTPEYKCSFENGFCAGWIQSQADEQDWLLHRGKVKTEGTGPESDHSVGLPLQQDRGYYMYADSSSPSKPDDRAILLSPALDGGKRVCFTYWYNLNSFNPGAGISVLYISLVDQNENKYNTQQISLTNKMNNANWQSGFFSYDLVQGNRYYLVILFKRGNNFAADVAIDDLDITFVNIGQDCPNDPRIKSRAELQFGDFTTQNNPFANFGGFTTQNPGEGFPFNMPTDLPFTAAPDLNPFEGLGTDQNPFGTDFPVSIVLIFFFCCS